MGIFRKRPLAFAAFVSAGTALAAVNAGSRQKLILLACFLTCGFLLSLLSVFRRRVTARCTAGILACAASACLLVGSWAWFGPVSDRYLSRAGESVAVEGYVTERLSAGGNGSRFTVRLTEFDGTPVRDRVLLECAYRSALSEGDRFRLTGQVREFTRDGSYEEETSLRSDGLAAVVTCSDYGDCTITGERTDTPMLALRRLNLRFCERLRSAVGGEEGALASALLLGNRSGLSGETVLNFRRSGISHLLALSGLHVSILIGILEWILGRFRVPKRIRIATVPFLALFYLVLTGAAVSTVRAVLMVVVLSLAFLSAERYDSFTALSVALFCILAVTPYAVLDLSLWLSFGAAASIIVFLPAVRLIPTGRLLRILPRPAAKAFQGLVTAVATGLFATCGTLGISVLFIGSVSVFSVPVTLLLSPLVTVALFLGLFALLLPIPPVAFLLRLPLSGMLWIAGRTSEVRNALIIPTSATEKVFLTLSVLAVLAVAVLPLKRKRWVAVPLVLSALFLSVSASGIFLPRDAVVTYLHEGAGEGLVVTSDCRAAVIDCSDGSSGLVYPTVSALSDAGIAEIDDLIFTHYHSKATLYLDRLSSRVLVRRLRLPEPQTENEAAFAARMEQEAALHGIAVLYGTDGLSVPDTQILWNRHFNGTGLEASVGFSLQVRDKVFTALSAERIGSDDWLSFYPRLKETDVFLILSHGRTAKRAQTVRLPERVSCVLWGDEASELLYPAVTPPPQSGVGESRKQFRIKASPRNSRMAHSLASFP